MAFLGLQDALGVSCVRASAGGPGDCKLLLEITSRGAKWLQKKPSRGYFGVILKGLFVSQSLIRNTPSTAGNSMTSSERPSPEPIPKKEASPAVLGGENSGNALEASNALNYRVWGIPAVLSRGIPGNALRAFPGSFRNFSGISSGNSQPYGGCGPPQEVSEYGFGYGSKRWTSQFFVDSQLRTQRRKQPHQSSSKGNFFARVRFGGVLSTVEEVVRVPFCCLLSWKTNTGNTGRTVLGHRPSPKVSHKRVFTLIGWQPGNANTGFCNISATSSANTFLCNTLALSHCGGP